MEKIGHEHSSILSTSLSGFVGRHSVSVFIFSILSSWVFYVKYVTTESTNCFVPL